MRAVKSLSADATNNAPPRVQRTDFPCGFGAW